MAGTHSAIVAYLAQLLDKTTCYYVEDRRERHYWLAMLAQWHRKLIAYAHGGHRLTERKHNDSHSDLARHGLLFVRNSAWIGSTCRCDGFGVREAAVDV